MRSVLRLPVWILALGACGGEGISVRGELAPGFPPVDRAYAVEAGRDARVRGGRFELEGLGAAPVSIRLLSGEDTLAWIDLADVPAATAVLLRGLKLDPDSRRAFPDRVEGTGLLTVNGIRFGPPSEDAADAEGVVLAATEDGSALLFRTHSRGPDLRVVVDDSTVVLTSRGEPVHGWTARAGDSLRVSGAAREGMLRATRLVLPPEPDYAAPAVEEREPESRGAAPAPAPAPPPAVREPRDDPPGRGRGRGRGKGKGRG